MTTTLDDFLSGRLQIEQPKDGYRAGMDPALLAAACPAKAGETVLDLGCGVGTAGLCLAYRTGARVSGVDIMPEQIDLAQSNAVRNGVPLTVTQGDAMARPTPFYDQSFDHVMTNPPFFVTGSGKLSGKTTRDAGRFGAADLDLWLGTAFKRLKPKGRLTLIQRMERLPDVLKALDGFGDIEVLPLIAKATRVPEMFLLRARKGARGAFYMMRPLVLHQDEHPPNQRAPYTETVENILRHGAELPWQR